MKPKYNRQTSIINIEQFRENLISIVGCGANGSFIAVALAKMGLTKFYLWDFDKVEPHNLPNQFFGEKDIGMNKARATGIYMQNFNSDCSICYFEKFSKNNYPKNDIKLPSPQIMISCVDKMSVRKEIFECCKNDKKVQLFIDTRMGGLQGQIYFIDMNNKEQVENYEKTLFGDDEAVQQRCTERSIIYTVMGIASLVCNQIVKAFKKEEIANYIVLDFTIPQLMI